MLKNCQFCVKTVGVEAGNEEIYRNKHLSREKRR